MRTQLRLRWHQSRIHLSVARVYARQAPPLRSVAICGQRPQRLRRTRHSRPHMADEV